MACAREPRSVAVVSAALGQATLGECKDLWYDRAAGPDGQRADFVRGASGLAYFGDDIAIIQDDTQFLALVSQDGSVHSLTLPAGPDQRHRFELKLGNKHLKPDWEAVTAYERQGSWLLLAFGSGSSRMRENILVVENAASARASSRIVPAHELYAMLRAQPAFSGGGLNLEGAAVSGNDLVLVQRGLPRFDSRTVNATLRLDLRAFLSWLDEAGPLPKPLEIRRYDLSPNSPVAYGFSGLTALGKRRFAFTASAEATTSALLDGPVLGSKIGELMQDRAWAADLVDARGRRLPVKAEGILAMRDSADGFWIVLDSDNTEAPARLCGVRVRGPLPIGDK
jgi:hypothetical protein